jgi:hypothetical protein
MNYFGIGAASQSTITKAQ